MSTVLGNTKKGEVGEYLKENIKKDATISISSPIFTIYAFNELRKVLESSKKFKFLFNEPTFVRNLITNNKDVKEFELQMADRERNLSEFNLEIGLKNNLDQNQIASKCAEFIREKAEVKSAINNGVVTPSVISVENTDNKYFIQGANVSFSKDGLGYTNTIRYDFNTVNTEEDVVNEYNKMFNEVFNNKDIVVDVKEELLKHLSNLYKENSPELLYYLTLYNIFKEKVLNEDDVSKVKEKTGITETKIWHSIFNFQHDAVVAAIKKLELYNGCIIADSVGLGKTFEALAIIKYYELRNNRVMVLCPKKLRSNWTGFKQNSITNPFADDRFNYDVLNHTDLSRSFGKSGDIDLERLNWGNYDLVVIDESHNFRNDNPSNKRMTRYQKLIQEVIKKGVNTKVLMLSATPVNNSLVDLKNQIRFITGDDDTAFAENIGIPKVSEALRLAQSKMNQWSSLPKEERTTESLLPMLDYDFFNLLNTITIARSRKHIQTYYDTKDIGEFPERNKPISIKSEIDLKKKFPELGYINGRILQTNLAVYSPMLYILPTRRDHYADLYDQTVKGGSSTFKQEDREKAIVNLMRVNVLKRMESSVNSFAITLKRILDKTNETIKKLEGKKDLNDEFEEDDELDDDNQSLIGGKIKIDINDIDIIKYKQDLIEDRDILEELYDYAKEVDVVRDAKLKDLIKLIEDKINNPINSKNQKVIIFTTFSDTAQYLYENTQKYFNDKYGIYSAVVTGNVSKSNNEAIRNDFESILAHFSPNSNHFDAGKNELTILFATDCISEGQNLQDCDYLVNYDIHWNPVRIVQRFGRIDRIGSKNKTIQLVNFWPNMDLDEYINLESRVRNKMVVVVVTSTGDENIINPEYSDMDYRKEQLKQLQTEVLDAEDMQGGISITDLNMDDFIMSLERYMKANPKLLEKYPTGVYAVTDITDRVQNECEKGVIYCLKQKRFATPEESATSLYPYYLVYVKENGDIHITNSNPKKILDIFKVLCETKTEPIEHLIKEFNKDTQNGNDMSKYTELLEQAVFDIKGVVEKKGLKSIFNAGSPTILDNSINGLNDFELISFLAIK